MRLWNPSWLVIALGVIWNLGCQSSDMTMNMNCPLPVSQQCGAALSTSCWTQPLGDFIGVSINAPKPNVDILLVVDNSSFMGPKQKHFVNTLPQFVQQLDTLNINYHIGVITTNVGGLPPPGNMFPGSNDPRCGTLAGDDGLLQNVSCRNRMNTSAEFNNDCMAACPTSIVPTQRYISRDNGVLNVSDAAAALRCIAMVGDNGCGLEAPLEASRRALDGHLAENSGFLRPDSLLVVLYVTDEDDCSIKLDQRTNANPNAMDCGVSGSDPAFRCYNLDYRCMAKDVQCDQPMNNIGPKTGCKMRTDSWLESLDTYHQFFSTLRRLGRLMVGGVWSPSMLDFAAGKMTAFGNGQLQVGLETGTMLNSTYLNRGKRMEGACYNPDPTLTSDPIGYSGSAQIRLHSFTNKFDITQTAHTSICNVAGYGSYLTSAAAQIERRSPLNCLSLRPTFTDGRANCLVGFVDAGSTETALPSTCLPQCSSACCGAWASATPPSNANTTIQSACAAESTDCYCAVQSTAGACGATAVGGIWRPGNAMPPAGQTAFFSCQ